MSLSVEREDYRGLCWPSVQVYIDTAVRGEGFVWVEGKAPVKSSVCSIVEALV